MYPRRFALCVGMMSRIRTFSDAVMMRRESSVNHITKKKERVKVRDELLPPCPVAIALAAIRPCHRLSPCIKSQSTPEGSQPLSGMRYAIRFWIDDQATRKALVGDASRRSVKRRVRAIP
ncbi:NBS-LRR type resistance protein [Cucumis melo var. makuwa]|uniref:NBS-LRR type resistance protein n=1 Tax=Cucumis melo var. makuwa TaxID=1194695 RepID=A0A5A7SWU0_CUCMM|nr:NBS-LRR type resistance protein [Cucumis melo var. makuwa]